MQDPIPGNIPQTGTQDAGTLIAAIRSQLDQLEQMVAPPKDQAPEDMSTDMLHGKIRGMMEPTPDTEKEME